MLSKNRVSMAVLPFLVAFLLMAQGTMPESGAFTAMPFRYNYYEEQCERDVEEMVWSTMHRIVAMQHNAPAQLLRLLFHDCFIGGCDASVLLANSNKNGTVEREAIPNRTLKGFSFIDMIKDEIEEACPGVVSCSDILVLATRDGIVLAGGPYYPVLTGRKDSKESFFDEAMAEIPRPNGNISETLRLFSLRGFDERETVALLGGHNIGKIGCEFIRPRLSNFMGTGLPDPTIPSDFLEELKRDCPENNSTINNMLNERTARSLSESAVGASFDNHYYKTLMRGRGLLFADQQLMAHEKTAAAVIDYALDDGTMFRTEFAHAMAKLSDFGVLTGSQGEVRHSCSLPNSNQ
ncbi:putative Peroxidase 48 [Nicotiana tabacum]|uniref:Peroxidase n=2 Tax=Nicotiana TaxID=4085 RepID=A0A1S3Z5V7_TOBAC|nr:PREDICTED: putative Peroxidase 48 [Nicotiana sylvestris]XP_016459734.1 PREDICTED: putative Peroxidase 48 [Nicotiana tabacum]